MHLACGSQTLDLSSIQVMGVLNATPDSFSDGGRFNNLDAAVRHASLMVEQGATIIDVGGESTRPGAEPVSEQEELDRVIPIIERLSSELDAVLSVDTSTPKVMVQAIEAGAGLVNDVRAFTRPGAIDAVANKPVALCVMHMQGQPGTMQERPAYQSVVADIMDYLRGRLLELELKGFNRSQILVDPGFGFGKSLQHNLELLKNLEQFRSLESPVLVGLSRKSMFGAITGREVDERLSASIAGATIAAMNGANIVRVHDVKETADAMKVVSALVTV